MDAYFITGNKGKLKEIERIFGYSVKHVALDLEEIQEMDSKKVVEKKVKQAYFQVQKPVIVWDTSVYISCLNGFPGPLIKWFWETVTLERICRIAASLEDKKITVKAVLGYFDGTALKIFEAEERGTLPKEPKGNGGFGWDAIFIPQGSEQTFAQMETTDPYFHQFNNKVFGTLKEYLDQNKITIRQ